MTKPISKPPITNDPSLPPLREVFDPGNLSVKDNISNSVPFTEIPVPSLEIPEDSTEGKDILVRGERYTNDWRVKLSLAPGSNYLYNSPEPGILAPLRETNGVIFPYMPQISLTYSANYNTTDLVHSNYKVYQYANSSVDNVSIVGDFTAQDTKEALYLLAVIHFFRSATKMFFGQDENPVTGTPPPLCFLRGLGEYQFSEHPLIISSFVYALPNDVDYIPTYGPDQIAKISSPPVKWKSARIPNGRLPDEISPGGIRPEPNFSKQLNLTDEQYAPTYVPSKITLNITCLPVVSRASLADRYSTEEYARGKIYTKNGGRFW
jgi:hypothetical protein